MIKTRLFYPILYVNKFTWKSSEFRNIHCKLDKMLLNKPFIDTFTEYKRNTLPRSHSFTGYTFSNQHSKATFPFKYMNGWSYDSSYKDVDNNSLASNFFGIARYRFSKTLKKVKINLKHWDNNRKNNSMQTFRDKCEMLQNSIDDDNSDLNTIKDFYNTQPELANSLYIQSINLKQKAKADWLSYIDEASKIFYAKMNIRKASYIKAKAIDYFSSLYNSKEYKTVFPRIIFKYLLSENS